MGHYTTINWSKNGINLNNERDFVINSFFEIYFLKNSTLDQIGVYEVIAESSANVSEGIRLIVIHPGIINYYFMYNHGFYEFM